MSLSETAQAKFPFPAAILAVRGDHRRGGRPSLEHRPRRPCGGQRDDPHRHGRLRRARQRRGLRRHDRRSRRPPGRHGRPVRRPRPGPSRGAEEAVSQPSPGRRRPLLRRPRRLQEGHRKRRRHRAHRLRGEVPSDVRQGRDRRRQARLLREAPRDRSPGHQGADRGVQQGEAEQAGGALRPAKPLPRRHSRNDATRTRRADRRDRLHRREFPPRTLRLHRASQGQSRDRGPVRKPVSILLALRRRRDPVARAQPRPAPTWC